MTHWLLLTSLLAQPVDPSYAAAELEAARAGDPTALLDRLRRDPGGALAGLDAALRAEPPALERAQRLADAFQKLVGTGALRARVQWFEKLTDAERSRWRALAEGPAADAAAELERLGDRRGAAWAALAGASDPERLRGLAGTFEFLWDADGRSRAFARLAEVLLARGDAGGALAAAENAVKIVEESESVKDGPARRARAAVHRAARRLPETILDLKAAASPRAWPEGSEGPALCGIEMAEALAGQGDTPAAWEIYKSLVSRPASLPAQARARLHGSLARFHFANHHVAEAEAEAARGLEIAGQDFELRLLRGRAALVLGRREAAAEAARQVLAGAAPVPAKAAALRLLGGATREDEPFEEALTIQADDATLIDRARAAFERGDAAEALRQAVAAVPDAEALAAGAALALAAEAELRLGKREEARARAREALERWERLPPEWLVLGEPDGPDPEMLARRLLDLTDDPEEAWLLAQKAAAWRLLHGVAHIRFERAYRMRPAMAEMRKMVLEGERYHLRLLQAEVTFRPGKPGLAEPGAPPGLAAFFGSRGIRPLAFPVPFPSAEVRGALPEGALVAYAAGIETTRVFLFTKERFVSAALGLAPAALAGLNRDFRSVPGVAPPDVLLRGRRGFDQLLAAVAPLPEGTLRFAPCVELLGLPFEALVPPGADGAAPARLADVPFLGRDRAVAYVPAAGWVLRGPAAAAVGRTGIVADAFATLDGKPATIYGVTWTREEGARVEVDALVQALGGGRIDPAATRARGEKFEVALGKDAKEDLFKGTMDLAGMQALHVQGQAWWNADDWAMNGIGLAQAEAVENDGLLFAWEIINLGLEGRMVTLSASRDSTLAPPADEGVLALPRAFLLGGASALVLPAAPVEAATRRRFFARFHAERVAGKSAPEAARAARRELLSSTDPPADWPWLAVWSAGR